MGEVNKRRELFGLVILIFIAFLIRFFVLKYFTILCVDCTQYVTLAKNLINKGQYVSDGSHFPDIIQPPLYPFILSAFIPLFDNPELIGRIISAIFGSLLIIPFFFLGQRIFSKKAAFVGSILIAFYPALIESSVHPATESVFIFFIYTAMLTGWIAIERWNRAYFFLTGALFALSYLTRVEGIAYLPAFLLFSIIYSIANKKGLKGLLLPALVLLGFLICIFPYQVYVGKKMGSPFVIPKAKLILTHRALSRSLANTNAFEGMTKIQRAEKVYFGLNNDSSELLVNYIFFNHDRHTIKKETKKVDEKQYASRLSPPIYFKVITFNLWRTYKEGYLYGHILPHGLIIFLIIGFFNNFWAYPHWNKNLYLIIMLLAGHVFILSHFEARFLFPSTPIILLWLSIGILKAEQWLTETAESYPSIKTRAAGYKLSMAILVLFLAASVLPFTYMVFQQNFRRDDSLKKIGLWMKENVRHDSAIIASKPQSAFYGNMRYLTLPYAEYEKVLLYAKARCGDYILLYREEDIELRPQLKQLMEEGFTDPELKLIKKMETQKGGKIYLYEITIKGACPQKAS